MFQQPFLKDFFGPQGIAPVDQCDLGGMVGQNKIPFEMIAVTVLMTIATIYFGIDTRLTGDLAKIAVENVLLGEQL